MSISIFLFAVAVVAATIFLISVIDRWGNEKFIVPIACIGISLALLFLALSFSFVNAAHLLAWIKYDHVVALEYKTGTTPTRAIDPDKVIYQSDSTDNIIIVLMAWNNNQTYDDIIKGNH